MNILKCLALFTVVFSALNLYGAFSPAATVKFSDFKTLASQVAANGKAMRDPILANTVPNAIRNHEFVKMFGAMPVGSVGAAVLYVDAAVVSRLIDAGADANARARLDRELDRAKRWAYLLPCSVTKAAFIRQNEGAKESNGVITLPAGRGRQYHSYVVFSPNGKYVSWSSAAALAKHVHKSAFRAVQRSMGRSFVHISMNIFGARSLFRGETFKGGEIDFRITQSGLEVDASLDDNERLYPLAVSAQRFTNVTPGIHFFGVTTAPNDGAASEIFSAAGPEVASFIRQSMVFRRASNGSTTYFLNLKQRATEKNAIINNASPEARFAKILPEARNKKTLDTIMFCSPTAVLRMALPRIAAKLPLKESVLLQTGVALLRKVRGDGLGYMVWSEGGKKRIFFRMSNDELRGTARLWSLLLL
ncbi:MAG: hypothetical protein J6V88_06120 [Kiritimatiellae bacterium]|nr:hypothetical protein [Kiritimatiellia bacterium]